MIKLTDDEIRMQIGKCPYRHEENGYLVCGASSVPCQRNVEEGNCITLLNIFKEDSNNGN